MESMGIHEYRYICSDLFDQKPIDEYDVVYSNGFIEHFTDFNRALDLHVDYLRPGGTLLVMIPNKRYLRMIYGNLIDKENQRAHNLKCMDLGVFEKFAARKRLDTLHLDYFGGFPYKVHKLLQPWQKLIYYPVRMVSRKLHRTILSNPSALWSGTIIGIFRKASGTEDAPTG
jgi:SAM-dependent methyltransferase